MFPASKMMLAVPLLYNLILPISLAPPPSPMSTTVVPPSAIDILGVLLFGPFRVNNPSVRVENTVLPTRRSFVVRVLLYKLVVVAWVPVAREKVKFVRVDEAFERKPLLKAMVVPVAFSPVPRGVYGKANDDPPAVGQVVRQISPVKQTVVEVRVGMVTLPVKPSIARAETVEVAKDVGDDVAR